MREFEVVGLVKSKPLKFSHNGSRNISKHLKKMGWQFAWLLLWQQIILGIGYLVNLVIPYKKDRLLPAWSLAKNRNIPVNRCVGVNQTCTIAFINELKPDLIISAYFNQIVKADIISIPTFGILNVHPGWLPVYRGAMAYFWVLKNNSETSGVSVHWIDEGIDTGTLVARRAFMITPGMTQQRVLTITAVIGARLLKRIGVMLLSGIQPNAIPVEQELASYYPMPGSNDFNDYFKTRRYFRIRDLFRHILKIRS